MKELPILIYIFGKSYAKKNWLGQNLLGKAITEVSKIIRG
jgi:hypothetical protein